MLDGVAFNFVLDPSHVLLSVDTYGALKSRHA